MERKSDFILLSVCTKLGNSAWGSHGRLLALDQYSVSYFKNVPKDFKDIYDGKQKPKSSIPIQAIICVKSLDAESDKVQIKKLG